mmetsp:Transcript_5159/g.10916  ORF Transcript_5159/g.10916 Transcript_5159/m.10916 type:complete len:211 (+) Transcript_5159:206-838(+)
MLHGIFRHTTNLGPRVTLDGVLVVGGSGLEQGLVRSASSGHDTHLGTNVGGHRLLSSTGQAQTSGALVFVVCHDNGVGTRSTGHGAAIPLSGFHVADNGSFRHGGNGQDISDRQGGLLSAVDELTFVHPFGTNHEFIVPLVSVGIAELDFGNGSSTTGIVENFLNDSTNVTVLFGIVQSAQFHGTLAGSHMRLENWTLTTTLGLNVFTHG